jgi:DNA-binding response OmpR family regulator
MTDVTPALPILLLVEDEETLLSMLETALADEGFDVVPAVSGKAAIAELESNGTKFKGVITDIKLGAGPSGWDIGHRAREIVPNIPVIYMSGDSGYEWSAHGVPQSIMLQKPFALVQLITAISTLLNQAAIAVPVEGTNIPKH